ncbi:DUF317 domain-containing protein, partial [Streptomyces lycii]
MNPRRHHTPYLIAPRYLAGTDEPATRFLTMWLRATDWQPETLYGGHLYSRRTPDGLLEAVHTSPGTAHVPATHPALGWEFTARPAPGEPATWTVHFALATPPELMIALATALTDPTPGPHTTPGPNRPHFLQAPDAPEQATQPLEAAGWMRDLAQHECTWYAPDQQAVVVSSPLHDGHETDDGNWLFATRRANDNVVLWYATAHPHTPTHLVQALCTALADPAP